MAAEEVKDDQISYYEANDLEVPQELLDFIEDWKDKDGNLIAVLHKVQSIYRYIPRKVAMKVSIMLDVPLAKIYGVITFYHLFKLEKPGKHKIQICMGTACYLKGANDLTLELEKILGIGVNGTTEDELFSLEVVRCVGCCGLAPVIMIGEDVYGNLTKNELSDMIATYTGKEV